MNQLYLELNGLIFNNKHNYKDIGVIMHKKTIQFPSKKKIKESLPFMNGSYDFSTIGSNGEITYTEREILVTLGLPSNTKEQLQVIYSNVLEWLIDVGKSKLIFDDISDYYYMAEVESTSTFEEVLSVGVLEVTFIAEPFKTSVDYVGFDVWDTFNFEEDIVQDIEFDIINSKTISIYNPRRLVIPTISCNSNMIITLDGYSMNVVSGNNKNWLFKLKNGTNNISIIGTGHIKFIFRKESL
jgi:predicted phage tail component-like protein